MGGGNRKKKSKKTEGGVKDAVVVPSPPLGPTKKVSQLQQNDINFSAVESLVDTTRLEGIVVEKNLKKVHYMTDENVNEQIGSFSPNITTTVPYVRSSMLTSKNNQQQKKNMGGGGTGIVDLGDQSIQSDSNNSNSSSTTYCTLPAFTDRVDSSSSFMEGTSTQVMNKNSNVNQSIVKSDPTRVKQSDYIPGTKVTTNHTTLISNVVASSVTSTVNNNVTQNKKASQKISTLDSVNDDDDGIDDVYKFLSSLEEKLEKKPPLVCTTTSLLSQKRNVSTSTLHDSFIYLVVIMGLILSALYVGLLTSTISQTVGNQQPTTTIYNNKQFSPFVTQQQRRITVSDPIMAHTNKVINTKIRHYNDPNYYLRMMEPISVHSSLASRQDHHRTNFRHHYSYLNQIDIVEESPKLLTTTSTTGSTLNSNVNSTRTREHYKQTQKIGHRQQQLNHKNVIDMVHRTQIPLYSQSILNQMKDTGMTSSNSEQPRQQRKFKKLLRAKEEQVGLIPLIQTFYDWTYIQPVLCNDGIQYGYDNYETLQAVLKEVNLFSAERFIHWNAFYASSKKRSNRRTKTRHPNRDQQVFDFDNNNSDVVLDNSAHYYDEDIVIPICPGTKLVPTATTTTTKSLEDDPTVRKNDIVSYHSDEKIPKRCKNKLYCHRPPPSTGSISTLSHLFVNAENVIIECLPSPTNEFEFTGRQSEKKNHQQHNHCIYDIRKVGGSHVLFGPSATNVQFRGFTFIGSSTSSIIFDRDCDEDTIVTFENCMFIKNKARYLNYGSIAAIHSSSKHIQLNFHHCSIKSNIPHPVVCNNKFFGAWQCTEPPLKAITTLFSIRN